METGIGLIVVLFAMYFIPWLIALMRGHHNAGAIFVLNLFLGWSLFGWIAALVWSMTAVQRRRREEADTLTWHETNFLGGLFKVLIFAILIVVAMMVRQGHAQTIGHPAYRGNASPGMMNRGPEAGYFNRARPPVPLINPYFDQPPPPPGYRIDRQDRERGRRGVIEMKQEWCQRHPTEFQCVRPNPVGPPIPIDRVTTVEDAPSQKLPDAHASGAGRVALSQGNFATHNGSLVEIIQTPDGYLDIVYVEPRPGLQVLPGVLLLRGKWTGPPPQNLVAIAFVFPPPPCRPVPYGVRGVVDQTGTLVLFGPAPIVAPGCVVVGTDWTRNSELRFEQVRQ